MDRARGLKAIQAVYISGARVIIVVDDDADDEVVHAVIHELQTDKENRFITAIDSPPSGFTLKYSRPVAH